MCISLHLLICVLVQFDHHATTNFDSEYVLSAICYSRFMSMEVDFLINAIICGEIDLIAQNKGSNSCMLSLRMKEIR